MFEAPSFLSFLIDTLIVVLYFNSPWIFGDDVHSNSFSLNPLSSVLIYSILAGLRIALFVPFVWEYVHDRHLVFAFVPYLWHSLNAALLVLRAIYELVMHHFNVFIWSILIGSLVSVVSQLIALAHLRNTAKPERHLALVFAQPNDSLVALLDPEQQAQHRTESEDKSLLRNMREVRAEWSRKMSQLQNLLQQTSNRFINETKSGEDIVFSHLLQLFTATSTAGITRSMSFLSNPTPSSDSSYKAVMALPQLFQQYPEAIEFYVPQLTVFLLYGSFETNSALQSVLLSLCSSSVAFAHKLRYFLVSFSLSGAGIDADGVMALRHLLDQIESAAEKCSRAMNEKNSFSISVCRTIPVSTSRFRHMYHFWDVLCDVSRNLKRFPRNSRTPQLQKELLVIDDEFLPSHCIYAPVANQYHSVYAIHATESFAFSTKDRAPIFVCLEIVEFRKPTATRKRRGSLSSWLSDIRSGKISKPQKSTDELSREASEESELSNSAAAAENRRKSTGALPSSHRSGVFDVGQWNEASPLKAQKQRLENKKDAAAWAKQMLFGNGSNAHDMSEEEEVGMLLDEERGYTPPLGSSDLISPNDTYSQRTVSSSGGPLLPMTTIPAPAYCTPPRSSRVIESKHDAAVCNISVDGDDDEDDRDVASSSVRRSVDDDITHKRPLVVFKERWKDKEKRIRMTSPIGHLAGWKLLPVIVKSNDDLRQEQCAAQLVRRMHQILQASSVDFYLRPYDIVSLSVDSGVIEAIPDTVSLDVLRRRTSNYISLKDFYERYFGLEDTASYQIARRNFIRSLASYCIICYILQLKDRHNGNILIDNRGHLVHIDFGFIFGKTPGGNIGFESAPFKLTSEFVELIGGVHSSNFHLFRDICVKVFMELRRHHHSIVLLLEMLSKGNEHLPCFGDNAQRVVDEFRLRFVPDVHDNAAAEHVHDLIDLATDNWTTTCYDRYQRCCVGVF